MGMEGASPQRGDIAERDAERDGEDELVALAFRRLPETSPRTD